MTRHPLLAVLLSVVLALGTILSGPAMARHGGTTVELCIGGSTATVTLDANGQPIPSHHPCPQCLAAQDVTFPPAAWTNPGRMARATATPRPPVTPHAIHHPAPTARGPPLPV